jgi:signal transduction histidine kinase
VIQILDALVDNALKFTHPGAHILLRIDATTRDDHAYCRIDLEDDGPGIPPDRLPHVFDSFVQGDGSDTRQYGGIGMGLSLARSLAEKMNGHLEVASEIGKGTTFSLYLPTD